MGFIRFLKEAFSDKGTPSSSRIISGWLSVSSMALIWYLVRHMLEMPTEKLTVTVGALPYIIGALAGFVVAPYGVNSLSNIFQKQAPAVPPVAQPVQNKEVTQESEL